MTVKVSKPAINVREELADLKKPTGIAGQAMLRAETPQEQFNLIGAGRRNLIINGGMDVWQRATSHTTASGYRSVDRWYFNTYTGGAFTVSKEVDSVHGNYLKWNRTSQDTSHSDAGNAIQQAIENAQYVIGDQYVTLSFWLKDEAGLGSGFVRLRQAASPYSRVTADNQDETWYSSSTEWEYHTFTFKIKSAADISMSNVQLLIKMDSGSALGGVSIAKVQLELGKVATPFEHRSYGEELALCQRYYERLVQGGDGYNAICVSVGLGSQYAYGVLDFKTTKRAAPTMSYDGDFRLLGAPNVSGITTLGEFYNPQINKVRMRSDTGGTNLTNSNAYVLEFSGANSISGGFIAADAEL